MKKPYINEIITHSAVVTHKHIRPKGHIVIKNKYSNDFVLVS